MAPVFGAAPTETVASCACAPRAAMPVNFVEGDILRCGVRRAAGVCLLCILSELPGPLASQPLAWGAELAHAAFGRRTTRSCSRWSTSSGAGVPGSSVASASSSRRCANSLHCDPSGAEMHLSEVAGGAGLQLWRLPAGVCTHDLSRSSAVSGSSTDLPTEPTSSGAAVAPSSGFPMPTIAASSSSTGAANREPGAFW